jgi:DNA polymerase-1
MSETFDLILIDGMNTAMRFHYKHIAFSYEGQKTGMLYGFLANLFSLRKKYKKAKIVICWDSPNLRKKTMNGGGYKSDRKKKPDEIYECIAILKDMLSLLGVYQYFCVGIEADDIAARLVKENSKKRILLITRDSDWVQFMNKKSYVYREGKLHNLQQALMLIGHRNAKEFISFLCITGTHNGVKGIKGIGKKKYDTVKMLVKGHSSIKKVISSLKNNDDKVAQMIYAKKEIALNNHKLVVPILDGYEIKEIPLARNVKKLIKVCKKYNLKSIIKKLEK